MTCNEAVPVLPAFVPVTVCAPADVAVQLAPEQDPLASIENVVVEVTSPSELSYWSRPSAVYACEPPAVITAEAGDSAKWSSAPAVTLNDAVPVLPPSLPVTVWVPASVAVQLAPVQDPFGPIENVVPAVTSPSELLYWSSAFGRVRLRIAGCGRRRGRRQHQMVERTRGRRSRVAVACLAAVAPGHRVRARRRRGAAAHQCRTRSGRSRRS